MSYQKTSEIAIAYFTTNKLLINPTVKDIQIFLTSKGYNAGKPDNKWGPQTDWAYSAYIEKATTGKLKAFRTDTVDNVPYLTKKSKYPSYKEIETYYGTIEEIPSKIVTINVPFTHIISYDTSKTTNKVSCHKDIADVYLSILEKVVATYGKKNIHKLGLDLFGGAYYAPPRKMKGGNLLSTHSYGIAFDYDPEHNQLRWGREKAKFALPDYHDWMNIWSDTGAFNLGEIKNYDWMHFQFSKP